MIYVGVLVVQCFSYMCVDRVFCIFTNFRMVHVSDRGGVNIE